MKPRSLKSRALQLLAQRDQSRLELKRKLLGRARRDAAAARLGTESDAGTEPMDGSPAEVEASVEHVLDWLADHSFLSDARFVESRVHARSSRFGNLRIHGELARHGVTASDAVSAALAESELARAAAVRERRFPALPADPAERARQGRFLAGRGFSPEVIQRVLRPLRA